MKVCFRSQVQCSGVPCEIKGALGFRLAPGSDGAGDRADFECGGRLRYHSGPLRRMFQEEVIVCSCTSTILVALRLWTSSQT